MAEGSVVATMKYDGLNRRISKAVTNCGDMDCTYHYYYDGWRLLEERNGSGQVLRQYVWGLGYVDELVRIAVNDDPANGDECETFYYPLHDANFNVLGLADAGGGLVERYEYTPYGQRTVYKSSGSNDPLCLSPIMESQRVKVDGVDQPYGICDVGHQGLFHEKEFHKINNRTRYLDSILCRYTGPDPKRYVDGMNYFEYVRNNPIRRIDPTGLWAVERNGEARAIAIAEEKDTLRTLAKKIHLTAIEVPLWAQGEILIYPGTTTWYIHNWSVGMVTDDVLDTEICPGEKVSIPNTAYIDASSYSWGPLGCGLMMLKEAISGIWKSEKLRVVYSNTWVTSKEIMINHLQADDIYKYLYIGHGASGALTGLKDNHEYETIKGHVDYWYGLKGTISPGKYTKYGIADLSIIACSSCNAKEAWLENVSSPLGVLHCLDRDIHVWDMLDSIKVIKHNK